MLFFESNTLIISSFSSSLNCQNSTAKIVQQLSRRMKTRCQFFRIGAKQLSRLWKLATLIKTTHSWFVSTTKKKTNIATQSKQTYIIIMANSTETFGALAHKSERSFFHSPHQDSEESRIIVKVVTNPGSPSSPLVSQDIAVWGSRLCSIVEQLQIGSVIRITNLKAVNHKFHSIIQLSTTKGSQIL